MIATLARQGLKVTHCQRYGRVAGAGGRVCRWFRASRLLACLALALLGFPAQAQWAALERLQRERGAEVSAMVHDLGEDRPLAALQADRRLSPASLTKLVLAATALEHWPGEHRFRTRLYGALPDAEGRLPGDLWLAGEGDPSLEHRDLWMLAARLRQRGVRHITGDLVVSTAPWGRLGCETQDRCDALTRTRTAYDAPLSAVGVDYGTWCIDVEPGRPGTPARLQHCAAFELPVPLQGVIESRGNARGNALWLDRRSLLGEDHLVMGGQAGRDARLYRSMSDPAMGAGLLLRQALLELGVIVEGALRVADPAPPPQLPVLVEHEGAPLSQQVAGLLRYSNNFVSDLLTLGMAAAYTPLPVRTLARASLPLEARIRRARGLAELPPEAEAIVPLRLLSGSGLTPENRLSAEDLVALLREVYHQPQVFPLFYAGLVVPAEAPNPLLREGNADWRQRVALKTGTLTVPRSVFGTAGYLRRQDGGWQAFAILVNGPEGRPLPMPDVLAAIRTDVEAWLTRH